jgi:uncharacterized DUF497 family protein
MNVVVETLVIENDRPAHISKHNVTLKEVVEVISGSYVFIKGKYNRWLLIGRTKSKRFLTVVVGARKQKNTYGLITARPSSKDERGFYKEFVLQHGGVEND